jgi:hypothetical protein
MTSAVLLILGAVGLLLSALFMVGVAASLVFNLLGFLWGGLFLTLLTCLYCGSIAWAWRDARLRGKPGWAAALLVAAGFWPASLLLWVLFRPEKKTAASGANASISPPAPPPVITSGAQ